jgi:hypothetical protein
MKLGDVRTAVSEEVDKLDPGDSCVVFGVSLGRVWRSRPARLVTQYSHTRPRFAQRPHVGFSLLHLTLESAQARQLHRSLGAAGTVDRRVGAERVNTSGEYTAAMVN